jgi:hypothetical protein
MRFKDLIPIPQDSHQGWEHGSSGKAPAYQAQSPKFTPQYHQKSKRKKIRAHCKY